MPVWLGNGRIMEKPDDLRKLAEWYRGMAEVGHTDDCGWRKRFAAYLDKRASELEEHPHRARRG